MVLESTQKLIKDVENSNHDTECNCVVCLLCHFKIRNYRVVDRIVNPSIETIFFCDRFI